MLIETLSLVISASSFVISLWVANLARREADIANRQYRIAVEEHRQNIYSNVILYLRKGEYDIKNRLLPIDIVNAGQIPVTDVHIQISAENSSDIQNIEIPIIFPNEAKDVRAGEKIYEYLAKQKILNYSPRGLTIDLNTEKLVKFTIRGRWTQATFIPLKNKFTKELVVDFRDALNGSISSRVNAFIRELK